MYGELLFLGINNKFLSYLPHFEVDYSSMNMNRYLTGIAGNINTFCRVRFPTNLSIPGTNCSLESMAYTEAIVRKRTLATGRRAVLFQLSGAISCRRWPRSTEICHLSTKIQGATPENDLNYIQKKVGSKHLLLAKIMKSRRL